MSYLLLALAVPLWVFGLLLLFRRMALYFGGNIVDARLLGFKKREFKDGKRYFPLVEYSSSDSSVHEAVGVFSYARKEDCPKGAKFRVLYLPSKPDRGIVYSHMQFWSGAYFAISLAMAATLGFLKLWQAGQTFSN